MPVINRIADFAPDMTAWRQHLHAHPEINFDCHETAAFVVEKLRSFGITEISTGHATSGVIAVIEGQGAGPSIGLRADMDALPMDELTGLPYASESPGAMHACGHDGHTTMLLGAARYLAETRRFAGRVVLIFQPAEELGGGAGVMVDEGLLEKFEIDQLYALHCLADLPIGQFATCPGPIMAAVDTATVRITGVGGHGAMPHLAADPVVAAVAMAQAFQTIVSRNHDPMQELVVSVTQIHAGSADNVIPETAWLQATVRTFAPAVQAMVQRRMEEIVAGQAAAFGVEAELSYEVGYPATVNEAEATAVAVEVARDIAGAEAVDAAMVPQMGSEDFAFFLQKRPGAYLFVGNGPGHGVHHPKFDFADEAAPYGASFFARLVERLAPV
ncbi:MAG: M20 aminoacylase family protein [Pseudomonadota bacterium]